MHATHGRRLAVISGDRRHAIGDAISGDRRRAISGDCHVISGNQQQAAAGSGRQQSASISANERQSASISGSQRQSASISVDQRQPASISVNQRRSASVSVNQRQPHLYTSRTKTRHVAPSPPRTTISGVQLTRVRNGSAAAGTTWTGSTLRAGVGSPLPHRQTRGVMAIRGTRGCSADNQWQSMNDAQRGRWSCSSVSSDNQCHSTVLSGHQRSSATISASQRYSVVISGHRSYA